MRFDNQPVYFAIRPGDLGGQPPDLARKPVHLGVRLIDFSLQPPRFGSRLGDLDSQPLDSARKPVHLGVLPVGFGLQPVRLIMRRGDSDTQPTHLTLSLNGLDVCRLESFRQLARWASRLARLSPIRFPVLRTRQPPCYRSI